MEKVEQDPPLLKDNCYTLTISNLQIFQKAVENYYYNKDEPTSTENELIWRNRKGGNVQLHKYIDLHNKLQLTITLHWTTGTVCIQGNKHSLTIWKDQHYPTLIEKYNSSCSSSTISCNAVTHVDIFVPCDDDTPPSLEDTVAYELEDSVYIRTIEDENEETAVCAEEIDRNIEQPKVSTSSDECEKSVKFVEGVIELHEMQTIVTERKDTEESEVFYDTSESNNENFVPGSPNEGTVMENSPIDVSNTEISITDNNTETPVNTPCK